MALSKTIETPFGVPATYWTITRFSIDRVSLNCEIQLAGYADQQAEADKKSPLAQRNYNVSFAENPPPPPEEVEGMSVYLSQMIPVQAITPELIWLFQTISQFGYGLVKLSYEFKTSTDV